MQKKLPKVFANKIEKKLNNNETIYSSGEENKEGKKIEYEHVKIKTKTTSDERTISQKINKIFSSRNYVYKIPVIIKTKDSEIITKIIGKNKTNIITIDNELIMINQIKDIEIYEEQKNE